MKTLDKIVLTGGIVLSLLAGTVEETKAQMFGAMDVDKALAETKKQNEQKQAEGKKIDKQNEQKQAEGKKLDNTIANQNETKQGQNTTIARQEAVKQKNEKKILELQGKKED